MEILRHTIDVFRTGRDVDPADAEAVFDALIGSEDELLITAMLHAWNEKGVSEDELFHFASIMRRRMKRVNSQHTTFVDAVGTGGSLVKTFNVSTAAAFVIAGAGVAVAKHGNRAATSLSGSADVMTLLGIDVDIDPSDAERHLNEIGICFMFAPRFHSLSPMLAAARRRLGQPTIFNNLGPLCNPAAAPHHVIGVADGRATLKTARVLARLDADRSWVVRGGEGLDEISLTGKTHVVQIDGGSISEFEVSPADFGIDDAGRDIPSGCTATESAALIRQIFDNERSGSDAEALVLINAAAAIYVAGGARDLRDAYLNASESVRSGAARENLTRLAHETSK
ncbi:MAG: anthranilate phosphoribosyltransferase [Pyrinomonadaceae bacterium]|nr:anthranilate phosphoribosyltransferase [Pyrinomonadaceae bacterium]